MLAQTSERNHVLSTITQIWVSFFLLKHIHAFLLHCHITVYTLNHTKIKPSTFKARSYSLLLSNIQTHALQLYCSSRPALTVIDRCLQSHSTKSDMRHMGVPPSCHVHLPMSPLWLRWRWQEQSGACQSNRKRLTHTLSLSHTHTHRQLPSLLQEQPSYTLAVNPPLSVSAVINFPDFQWAGELPLAPTSLTGDSHWGLDAGNASLSAGSLLPVNTASQRP